MTHEELIILKTVSNINLWMNQALHEAACIGYKKKFELYAKENEETKETKESIYKVDMINIEKGLQYRLNIMNSLWKTIPDFAFSAEYVHDGKTNCSIVELLQNMEQDKSATLVFLRFLNYHPQVLSDTNILAYKNLFDDNICKIIMELGGLEAEINIIETMEDVINGISMRKQSSLSRTCCRIA